MSGLPTFAEFYRAVHDRPPFPWQERLAGRVRAEGWPDEIGVATGLGKTACIDIAVWALAGDSERPSLQRHHPRRIWYVVNRRLLVDAADEAGNDLVRLLKDPSGANDPDAKWAISAVAEALRSLGSVEGQPLHITRLRGGAALGQRPPDPSVPTVLLATVPMFASRWLFRGYGSSTLMSPVDAALAGTDSLVLLDEAHLAVPLTHLGTPLAACDPGAAGVPLPAGRQRPRLVRLTATGEQGSARFDLDDEDLRNSTIAKRLAAPKPTSVERTDRRHLVEVMAHRATEVLDENPDQTCLVFANTPRTAREVFDRVARGRPEEVLLLTGQVREPDASALRERILDRANGLVSNGVRAPGATLRCVVATQTLEVGADLDVDHLVTESAGRRALVQRLGRLNRLGEKAHATATVCHADDGPTDLLYGNEPVKVTEILERSAPADLSPASINTVLGPPQDAVADAAEPLPSLVWEWVKTSLPPPGEAPVELYFSEPEDDLARVSICWRASIPAEGRRLRPPVRSEETVDVGIGALRALLRAESTRAEPWVGTRLAPDRLSVEGVGLDALRPGDVLVMLRSWGNYDQHGWAPGDRSEVTDLGLAGSQHLALDDATLEYLFAHNEARDQLLHAASELAKALTSAADGAADPDPDDACDELLRRFRSDDLTSTELGAPAWEGIRGRLPIRPAPRWLDERPDAGSADGVGRQGLYLVLARPMTQDKLLRSDADDDLSFLSKSAGLEDHLVSVGAMAERIGFAVGLAPTLVDTVRLAGQLHDLGKYDDRFQRMLGRSDRDPPLAKSGPSGRSRDARQAHAGWPRGGRHEVLSARMVEAWLSGRGSELEGVDRDLLVHLVIAHHGHGRPSTPVTSDAEGARTVGPVRGANVVVSSSLAQPEWLQPLRFRRLCERYGYWGLALLEAVVRQADHRASGWIEAESSGAGRPIEVEVI